MVGEREPDRVCRDVRGGAVDRSRWRRVARMGKNVLVVDAESDEGTLAKADSVR